MNDFNTHLSTLLDDVEVPAEMLGAIRNACDRNRACC